ncbi:hypothetical protein GGR57DRAFT_500753 [Xylariaceae sp. FL1272]|nr:hypothetical protein GGR57DRAFT_500753 [Xylariaceae sp. FL1272]
MAPAQKPKADFKTYESSTRLLAAVIATTGCKLDFKELARHVGGRATKDSVNHRLRPIKHLAKLQVRALEQGQDPGDLPVETQAIGDLVDASPSAMEHRFRPIKKLGQELIAQLKTKNTLIKCATVKPSELKRAGVAASSELLLAEDEIHRLFGESTPNGIEWQFRDIKALAKAQKEAADKEEDVTALTIGNAGKGGRGAAKKGAVAGEKTAATPKKGGAGGKRKRASKKTDFDDTTSEEPIELDDDTDEPTPKRAATNNKTQAAAAATPKAAAAATPKVVAATPKAVAATPKAVAATPKAVAATPKAVAATPKAVKQPAQANLPAAPAYPAPPAFDGGYNRFTTSGAQDNFNVDQMFLPPSAGTGAVKQEPSGLGQYLNYDHVRDLMDEGLEDGEI